MGDEQSKEVEDGETKEDWIHQDSKFTVEEMKEWYASSSDFPKHSTVL